MTHSTLHTYSLLRMKTSLFVSLLFIIGIATFVSCSESQVYKNFEDVKQFSWEQQDAKTFSFEIQQADVPHRVHIALRHITETPLNNVPVKYTITAPGGSEETGTANIMLRDTETGKLLGEVAYQFTDIDKVVEENWTPKAAGNYTVTVSHNGQQDPVPTVMEVGLLVEKVQE